MRTPPLIVVIRACATPSLLREPGPVSHVLPVDVVR
jgi:hypothetical protein